MELALALAPALGLGLGLTQAVAVAPVRALGLAVDSGLDQVLALGRGSGQALDLAREVLRAALQHSLLRVLQARALRLS
jgi:hypothetical protein